MTNWKIYTITKMPEPMHGGRKNGSFDLDGNVSYSERNVNFIWCVNTYPYNAFKLGDKIEIDNDRTKYYSWSHDFDDLEIVRRASSSTVVPSSSSQQLTTNQFQAIGNQMMDRAERSGGEYEAAYVARQEYGTDGNISAHEMRWVYRKSK